MLELVLLLFSCGDPSPPAEPTRDDWARIAVEDPDPIARRDAVVQLHFLDDPDLPGVALASLKGHDRAADPAAAHDVGAKLLMACLKTPNSCPLCGPCPADAHPACNEIDWDREGCFPGEGDACPVPSRPRARDESLCPPSQDVNLADWHVEQARFLALVERTSVGLSLDVEGAGAFLTGDVYCEDPARP